MEYLNNLHSISFEVGTNCNLKEVHKKCPINYRKYKHKDSGEMSVEKVVECIDEACDLGFNGLINFNYYNEPAIYLDKIMRVINLRPDNRYSIWTNGLLLDILEIEDHLDRFAKIVITCYEADRLQKYKSFENKFQSIEIKYWKLDNRVGIYASDDKAFNGCRRALFELPIDYYGNVHLCCYDWNNEYELGNVFQEGFSSVVMGERYQEILKISRYRKLRKEKYPDICHKCDNPWTHYSLNIDYLE